MAFSTAPGILIAVPQLVDPNFLRSVVVMIEHNEDGALGLVVNHPTDQPCASIVEALGLPWHGGETDLLLRGGPVEPQSLWMLHNDSWSFDETMRVFSGVAVSRSRDALTRMSEAGEQRLLLTVGYAGWGAGQLEHEISAGAWITSNPTEALVFDAPRDRVWEQALWSMGINPAHLVEGGGTVQ